jgi:hypothetical protein
MSRTECRSWCRWGAIAVIAAAVGLSFWSPSYAKRPGGGGGGGTPAGIIYFRHESSVWSMKPDGTSRTQLAHVRYGEPSHGLHGGERWFTQERDPGGDEPYPNGRYFLEWWAVSESGVQVALYTTRDIEILSPLTWLPGDASLTFIGERWSLDGEGVPTTVIDAGLYAALVAYDGNGDVAGIVPGSVTLLADLSDKLQVGDLGFTSNGEVAGHSWSNDNRVVFSVRLHNQSPYVQEIWIVDLDAVEDPHVVPADALALLASGNGIGWPEWSPDGSRIGYVSWDGTVIYNVANGRKKTLVHTANMHWGRTFWSPASAHFAIYRWDQMQGEYEGVYRITADLSEKARLTDGMCDTPEEFCIFLPVGWRN